MIGQASHNNKRCDMAKKTYDKPVSRQQTARASSGLASLLWMFVGALLAVMIGAFLYLSPLFNGLKKTDVEVNPPVQVEPLPKQEQSGNYEFYEVLPKREFQTQGSAIGEAPTNTPNAPNTAVAQAPTIKPDAVVKATKEPDNSAQTSQGVTIVEENDTYDGVEAVNNTNVQEKINISNAPNQSSYILQIRSYDNPEEADDMRAKVMMAGVDARILKRMDNEVALYQVISYTMTAQEVKTANQRLKENGIDSLIVEQRHH